MNKSYKIIAIRDYPDLLSNGSSYLSETWKIDQKIYEDCLFNSLKTTNPLPRWFFLLKEKQIIGSYGLITNDFISRQDLWPWFCAYHVDKDERGKGLGKELMDHGKVHAVKLGFKTLYLCTDHIGLYEKWGWKYIGDGFHPWGATSRIYEIVI